ncbi:hypothetical protein BDB00DRAFT_2329 [Zychaea mexicana]|uniref:uncharacterized protein n=1 Tax=Zychaea mexicana TaxID=64656 RepID=UPI0022FF2B1E|nr:uncharacterized protein BDB00DRAFT_2329 [Zychaea mexicana]KAI9499475.1 hypothetical protein BDB00DRAFT_2329 [Zychaea mexicana]
MDNLRPEGSGNSRRSSVSSSTRPPFVHSVSCPNIPELRVTTDSVHPCEPVEATPKDDPKREQRRRQQQQNDTSSTSSESDTMEDDDGEKQNNWASVPSPTRHNRISSRSRSSIDKEKEHQSAAGVGSDNELLEAALDHQEAQDRHVRFQDHVMESAALVERMLSIRDGTSQDDRLARRFRSNSVMDEADLEGGEQTVSSPGGMPECAQHETIDSGGTSTGAMSGAGLGMGAGGGSVLSSLMKLEAQRRRNEQEQEKKNQRRKQQKVPF